MIVTSTVKTHDRGNGTLRVHEQHIDDLGEIHERHYHAPVGFDTDTALAEHAAALPDQIITSEMERLKGEIEQGADPTTVSSPYLDRAQSIESIVKGAMNLPAEQALKTAIIADTVTDAELDFVFGVEKRQLIRNRVAGVLAMQQAIEADNALKVEL